MNEEPFIPRRVTADHVDQKVIRPAIISSFSVTGNAEDWQAFPVNCQFVELYAFMQGSLPGNDVSRDKSALEHLAELHRNKMTKEVAKHIQDCCHGRLLVAIATFLPELTATEVRRADWDNARDSLKLLIDAARLLNKQGHPIKTIELVGGSQIQSIHRDVQGLRLFAKRQTKAKSIEVLLERLKPIAEYALAEDPAIVLSVELEPGPLFILSDSDSVVEFCRRIERSGSRALARCVGLNLDIPHWGFLARISPEWLAAREQESVRCGRRREDLRKPPV